RQQVEKLTHEIPPCGAACGPPPIAASGASRGSALDSNGPGYGPQITITSRESNDAFVHLKGYFEGTDLKSAGIYDGSKQIKAFKVDGVSGRQRVEFDLKLEDPSVATTLRVADADSKAARASVLEPGLQPPASPDTKVLSTSGSPEMSAAGSEPPPNFNDDSSTAEIPSHGPMMPSPSKRRTLGNKLADVRINITSVTRTGNLPPTYEIVGQIQGRG